MSEMSYEDLDEVIQKLEVLKQILNPSPKALDHMNKMYSIIWPEACYDPLDESTRKFAQELFPHIQALNEIFKFKR